MLVNFFMTHHLMWQVYAFLSRVISNLHFTPFQKIVQVEQLHLLLENRAFLTN